MSIEIKNKEAEYKYFLLQKWDAGIVLTGTEIKSVKTGKCNLKDAYCYFKKGELWIKGMHISEYDKGTYLNHIPTRERKLLLTSKELQKIESKIKEKGLTLIPTIMFFNERGYAKLSLSLAKGKKSFDKRESIKSKEQKKVVDRIIKQRNLHHK